MFITLVVLNPLGSFIAINKNECMIIMGHRIAHLAINKTKQIRFHRVFWVCDETVLHQSKTIFLKYSFHTLKWFCFVLVRLFYFHVCCLCLRQIKKKSSKNNIDIQGEGSETLSRLSSENRWSEFRFSLTTEFLQLPLEFRESIFFSNVYHIFEKSYQNGFTLKIDLKIILSYAL